MAEIKPLISPWVPEADVGKLKRLGKALEEGGEYVSAVARCLIQGINESEPVTGKPNKLWLEEEAADVLATMGHLIDHFELDRDFINARTRKKVEQLDKWFRMEIIDEALRQAD